MTPHGRAEFERWARDQYYAGKAFTLIQIGKGEPQYADKQVEREWRAWQASAARGVVVAEGYYDWKADGVLTMDDDSEVVVFLPPIDALRPLDGKRIRLVAEEVSNADVP